MSAVAKFERKNSLMARFAGKYGVDENEVMNILKATAFKQRDGSPPVTNEQMMALMVIADQYNLNPFTREIYAYPDKNNGIVPVVGVDGWNRIINEHPQMDGIEFNYSEETTKHKGKAAYEWIEAIITRKDRSKPIVVREYFDEVVRSVSFPTPWDSHPKRMHRHKTEIQAARIAFGFAGIHDEDEAERILEKDVTNEGSHQTKAPEPTYYTNDEFEAKKASWKQIVSDGKKDSVTLVNFIESKGKLFTDPQKVEISTWKKVEVVEAELVQEEDEFLKELNESEKAGE